MSNELQMSEYEADILKEIINIGMAKVADSFAVLAQQPVLLQVPSIDIVPVEELDQVLPQNEREDMVVQSDIQGDMNAKDFLIFKQVQTDKLSDICIGRELGYQGNYNAMRRSLLLETSNILTGSLLTQFGNIFRQRIYGTPPVMVPYQLRKTFAELISNLILFKPFVFTIKTEFLNVRQVVELPMVIVFDANSIGKILSIIRQRSMADANWLAHSV
jgi:chemotaxis protein CheC